jgi:phosphatidylserine/phosphatidylglycerophosphate/cardiolipin synthase-like enzyme
VKAERRKVELRLVRDREHYDVVRAVEQAKVSVWIATANVKDLRVEAPVGTRARARGRYVSILEILDGLAGAGVEVRMLHAGVPSRAFQASLKATKRLAKAGFMRVCPRVHFKIVAIDGRLLYLGSANFTGAGLGAKGEGRRNFEAGIVTDDDLLLDEMQGAFEAVWSGGRCKGCGLRAVCPAPIDELAAAPRKKA